MYKFRNKSILITGGTGSFGKSLLDTLVKKKFGFKKIAVFSRDELKQHDLHVLYPTKQHPSLRFFLGDIRDKDRLAFAVKGFDIIVHAAALKQVLSSEYNPFEFIKTNIIGTQNVVDACLSSNVQKAILLSTDKSVSPSNLYGATKLCAERIFINSHNIKGNRNIAFSVVRYGNVFGSRGSVLHEFFKQKNNGEFMITDLRMTRFHITLEQSVDFVINSISNIRS
jgi:FlaA1/EpsC-like NDP-sugar epimerase